MTGKGTTATGGSQTQPLPGVRVVLGHSPPTAAAVRVTVEGITHRAKISMSITCHSPSVPATGHDQHHATAAGAETAAGSAGFKGTHQHCCGTHRRVDSAVRASSRSLSSLAITRQAASCWYSAWLSSCRTYICTHRGQHPATPTQAWPQPQQQQDRCTQQVLCIHSLTECCSAAAACVAAGAWHRLST
jgi:hypothetical protein